MQPNDLTNAIKNSPIVSFHRFVLLHREFKSDLFCFYEGCDSQYYFPRINHFNEKNHPIICGNKKSVLETCEIVTKKYPNFKTSFFVDSDFDEPIIKKNLYSTPCYSIENFYCSENVVSNILKNEFNLKLTDLEYKKTIDLFNKMQKEFHKSTSLFNVWYYTIKKKAKKKNLQLNVTLDDKFPKGFLITRLGEVKSNYDLNKINKLYPDALNISEKELNNSLKNFYDKEPLRKHRGKYEIEFIIKFLNLLIEDCNVTKTILNKKTKFKIDSALILTQLCQYAETPSCLKDYLKNCA